MKPPLRLILFLILLCIPAGAASGQELRSARLGDFTLENGQAIRNCTIGYRTFGDLDADKSNIVLFPTWFAGTTATLIETGMVGPGKVFDSTRFHVIAVDSIGDGVSSSPSNSREQPGLEFPRFSVRDMVEAEYLLLTREFKLNRIHAVVGISMGGMQALQWMVSHPDFFAKAVSIVGSPRPTSGDMLILQSEIDILETARRCGDAQQAMATIGPLHSLFARTPGYIAAHIPPADVPKYLADTRKSFSKYNPDDWERQLEALMDHDIFKPFGGSPEKAAAVVRARALIVMSARDLLVNPGPTGEWARRIEAKVLELDSDCGHIAFLCESEKLREWVTDFLTGP